MHETERDGSPLIRVLFTYTSRKEEFREICRAACRREQGPPDRYHQTSSETCITSTLFSRIQRCTSSTACFGS